MRNSIKATLVAAMIGATMIPVASFAKEEIPRAASTPETPKNWRGPAQRMVIQSLVERIASRRPDIQSITVHAVPPGMPAGAYTMIAGTFPDRIGNESSPGDIITAKKGVTQVESKWGTENYNKKVSIVVPLRDSAGNYLPAAMVIAFNQSAQSGWIDTDFMAPGVRIRDGLMPEIASFEALFAPAR